MVNFMKDPGRKIKCMVKVYYYGRMERNIKVTLLMINVRDKVHFHGLMVDNIQENGNQENNMGKDAIYQRKARKNKANGIMVVKYNGQKNDNSNNHDILGFPRFHVFLLLVYIS